MDQNKISRKGMQIIMTRHTIYNKQSKEWPLINSISADSERESTSIIDRFVHDIVSFLFYVTIAGPLELFVDDIILGIIITIALIAI